MSEKLKPGALLESYKNFIDWNAYYVDKTLFIEQVLDNPNKVQLYTRPRRFGKTLAMMTLKTFLEKKVEHNGNLFDPRPYFKGKKIMNCCERILSRMGQHPVIFLTLKDCGWPTYSQAINQFKKVFAFCFQDFEDQIASVLTHPADLELLDQFRCGTSSDDTLCTALQQLSKWIFKATGVKPYILIDEYDVPLQWAYINGYYDEMVSFIRSLFSSGMKTNDDNFEKAILTGCMRISKESIFTGFNNLAVYSISTEMDREYFGFTDDEVKEMLDYYDISEHLSEIHDWYDGYLFGKNHVFNPFSLVQCVEILAKDYKDPFRCYWVNSSGNDIIRDLIRHNECRDDLEALLRGEPIYKPIYESITYRDLDSFDQNIWTFLYFTGYIKSLSKQQIGNKWIHELVLVNREIHSIFPQFIDSLFYETVKKQDLSAFYQAIWDKNPDVIKKFINTILFNMVSYYDTQENFYHGMMLGILSQLYRYKIKSNREEGLGRTDIVLRDIQEDRAIVFEFKWCKEKKDLNSVPQIAIEQVRQKKYAEEIHNEGYKTVHVVGIGFCDKACAVQIEEM